MYDGGFFDGLQAGALRSARAVVPHVVGLLRPRRVVDLGCGLGAWLAAFAECGVEEVLGVDGDWVDRARLAVPPARFVAHDLRVPLAAGTPFDLAVSLEVAEHLPESAAGTLVGSLTRLAPVVLFSAAVPFQGGTGHVNEQWPEYWAALFRSLGYAPVDCLRDRFWADASVEWWYAQNMVLYGRPERLLALPALRAELATTRLTVAARVHPACYLRAVRAAQSPPRRGSGEGSA